MKSAGRAQGSLGSTAAETARDAAPNASAPHDK